MRCGDCKFWGEPEVDVKEYRPCTAVRHDENGFIYEWNDPDSFPDDTERGRKSREAVASMRRSLAVVEDGSGYFAALKTKEDFGCVLFTRRET